ncbi:TPA: AAA family ATPase [Vibrio parahaemolyticus]
MKIRRIKLTNFRQFYGNDNKIEFSTDREKNVTLIHAENGVGKTTILNSILWCFYDKFTADFEKQEELVNLDAKKEGITKCDVEVEFFHEGNTYSASRTFDSTLGTSKLSLFAVSGGSYEPIRSDKRFLNSVIPEDMAEYFLFHGEGISQLQANKGNFRKAIRDILGFTLAEQAIEDFGQIREKWNSKLTKINNANAKFVKVQEKLKENTITLTTKKLQQKDILDRLSELELERQRIDDEIISCKVADATELKKRIKSAENSLDSHKANLKREQVRRQKLIGEYGWRVFGLDISEKSLSFIDTTTLTGKVPAPYDETLVKDIISSARCICGRDVCPESPEHNAILSLLDHANTAEIKQNIMKARSFAETIGNKSRDFIDNLLEVGRSVKSFNNLIASSKESITQLNVELDKIDDSKLKVLRSQERDVKEKITRFSASQRVISKEIAELQSSIASLKKEVEKQLPSGAESYSLHKCIKFVEQLTDLSERKLRETEKDSKFLIAKDVNEILSTFSRKDYSVRVSDTFNFELVREDGNIVAKSKGEKLLLNLAFVSALINMAEQRSKADGKFLQPGTVAPFIIDAPFGELDETYREATAKFLPENSEQLVLLLSSSHWRGTVGKTIEDKVGSEYILVSHKKYHRNGKPLDEIYINNNKYNQSEYNSSFNGSTIVKVK